MTIGLVGLTAGLSRLTVGRIRLAVGRNRLAVGRIRLAVGLSRLAVGRIRLTVGLSRLPVVVKSAFSFYAVNRFLSVQKPIFAVSESRKYR